MDAAHLSELFLFVAILAGFARFLIVSLNQAESGFASLFVPPDRNLGWPRGVQEGDAPWGWRPRSTEVFASPDLPDVETMRSTPADWMVYRAGSFVIPVRRVAPIRLELRPH